MSFSETLFVQQCGRLTTGIDPLLNLFFRLHVAADLDTEVEFRARAAARLREEGLYRRWKLPEQEVERGLLETALSPVAFYALSRLYGVRVCVKTERCWFSTAGQEERPLWWIDARRLTIRKSAGENAQCEVPNPGKPLYASSHYTLRELNDLNVALGAVAAEKAITKAALYEAVQKTLHRLLFSAV